jgi:hypothetical protein
MLIKRLFDHSMCFLFICRGDLATSSSSSDRKNIGRDIFVGDKKISDRKTDLVVQGNDRTEYDYGKVSTCTGITSSKYLCDGSEVDRGIGRYL